MVSIYRTVRERERGRERGRGGERERERERERETVRERRTHTPSHVCERERERERERDAHTHHHMWERHRERQSERGRERQRQREIMSFMKVKDFVCPVRVIVLSHVSVNYMNKPLCGLGKVSTQATPMHTPHTCAHVSSGKTQQCKNTSHFYVLTLSLLFQ